MNDVRMERSEKEALKGRVVPLRVRPERKGDDIWFVEREYRDAHVLPWLIAMMTISAVGTGSAAIIGWVYGSAHLIYAGCMGFMFAISAMLLGYSRSSQYKSEAVAVAINLRTQQAVLFSGTGEARREIARANYPEWTISNINTKVVPWRQKTQWVSVILEIADVNIILVCVTEREADEYCLQLLKLMPFVKMHNREGTFHADVDLRL